MTIVLCWYHNASRSITRHRRGEVDLQRRHGVVGKVDQGAMRYRYRHGTRKHHHEEAGHRDRQSTGVLGRSGQEDLNTEQTNGGTKTTFIFSEIQKKTAMTGNWRAVKHWGVESQTKRNGTRVQLQVVKQDHRWRHENFSQGSRAHGRVGCRSTGALSKRT